MDKPFYSACFFQCGCLYDLLLLEALFGHLDMVSRGLLDSEPLNTQVNTWILFVYLSDEIGFFSTVLIDPINLGYFFLYLFPCTDL